MDTINKPPDRWIYCPPFGELIEEIFLPSKTLLNEDIVVPPDCQYTPRTFINQMRERKINVGLVINLTYSHRYYDGNEIQDEFNINYKQIHCRGFNEAPQESERLEFLRVCRNFLKKEPNKVIVVHCTHGFNRTGFMICSFLSEVMDWDIAAAISIFRSKRPPGIYKQDYINELFRLYGSSDDPVIQAAERPLWDSDEGIMMDPNMIMSEGNQSLELQFYEGIQDVHLVRDSDLKRRIYRHCCNLCGMESNSDSIIFPGAQPVSMDRHNIQLLKNHRYRVSWKADGCRYMMYIQDEDNIFFLTRSLQLWKVNGLRFPKLDNLNSHVTDTLIDGEMVTDIMDGKKRVPTYLIYDVISLNGKVVAQDNFDKRCGLIKCVIVEARSRAKHENLINSESEPFKIVSKCFSFVHATKKTLNLSLPHEKDGLIFQPLSSPYTGGTCSNILKWKPPELNSIDFHLVIQEKREMGCLPESVANLYVSNVRDRPFLSMRLKRDEAHFHQYNNKIVEMALQDGRWVVLKERTDKLRANSYETASSVMRSIREPVTEKYLLDFISSVPPESKAGR